MAKRRGSAIRVMIVDGIAASRKNLARLLLPQDDIEAVASARAGSEALRLAKVVEPDVILVSSTLADSDAVTLVETLAKETSAAIVFLSVSSDPQVLQHALRAGARCFLPYPPAAEKLFDAIRSAGQARNG